MEKERRKKTEYNRHFSINLWCCSLKHHHFCIPEIEIPILGFFLIPLVKSLVLMVQRDSQDRFLIVSKLTKL
jgi:hypothetical protein